MSIISSSTFMITKNRMLPTYTSSIITSTHLSQDLLISILISLLSNDLKTRTILPIIRNMNMTYLTQFYFAYTAVLFSLLTDFK